MCILSGLGPQMHVMYLSGFQLSVESNFKIAFGFAFSNALSYWLAKLTSLSQSMKTKPNSIVTWSHVFPALGAGDMYLLRILIGSLSCLSLLWLARVITLVLVLQHSNEPF